MRKERGAFLIIFCIILTLLLLTSLAVLDISNQRAEADHARHYVKLAAIEGLRAYQTARDENDNPTGTGVIEDNEAYWEGEAAKAATDYLGLADKDHQIFKNPTDVRKNINNVDHYDFKDILAKSSGAGVKKDMVLELGYWVNCKNDIEQVLDLCQKDGKPARDNQGFLAASEYRVKVQDYGNPNAVRVHGKWLQDSKTYVLRNFFGDDERIAPTVSATAILVPRHIYFLVDISDSGDDNTFNDKETDYVMCKHNRQTCYSGDSDYMGIDLIRPDSNTNKLYQNDYVRKVTFGDDDFDGLDKRDQKIHPTPSEDDKRYSLEKVTGSAGGWMSKKNRNAFLIHAYNNPANAGRPFPEPLTTIVNGVHNALLTMQKRKVTGDKAGLIFFTNGLVWPRMTKLTDDFEALMKLTDYVGTPNADLENIMQDDLGELLEGEKSSDIVNNAANGLERAIRFSIFPVPGYRRKIDGVYIPDGWTYTNIVEAVSAALEFINKDEGVNSDESLDPNIFRSIALFSDGLPNCIWHEESKKYRCYGEGKSSSDVSPYGDKKNAKSYYLGALAELNNLVYARDDGSTLRDKGIPFNVFHVGDSVGPHTLLIKKEDGTCYTDAEHRHSQEIQAKYPDYVTGGGSTFYSRTASNPYYYAAHAMYNLAKQTRGLYVPLRGLNATKCAPTKACVKAGNCDYSCDGKDGSRITKDPYCRPISKQVSDGIDEILAVNPYRLVDVK